VPQVSHELFTLYCVIEQAPPLASAHESVTLWLPPHVDELTFGVTTGAVSSTLKLKQDELLPHRLVVLLTAIFQEKLPSFNAVVLNVKVALDNIFVWLTLPEHE
jgi:hypothetical protein